jgi:hypothetical protein
MRWFKVAAIAVGILIAFLVVSAVISTALHILEFVAIAALVVGGVAVAIKVARSGKQVSRKKAEREVREPDYSRPLPRGDVEPVVTSYSNPQASKPQNAQPPRPNPQDIDEELARMKREMGA